MSKIATNIEQSRHLLELGLDSKTADMVWMCNKWLYSIEDNILNKTDFKEQDTVAWSLPALFALMPMVNEGWPVCCKIYGSEKWHVLYYSTAVTPKIDSGEYDTPIEAAYEMVCCLLEQGLIKK